MSLAEKTYLGPVDCNQPFMLRCFAAVETCHFNSAAVPSVRNAGGHESKALQVESPRPFFRVRSRSTRGGIWQRACCDPSAPTPTGSTLPLQVGAHPSASRGHVWTEVA